MKKTEMGKKDSGSMQPTDNALQRQTIRQQTGPREQGYTPALEQIGIVRCPVCEREVAIYRAKTNRPFLNCGFCSARIFYNGRESIRILLEEMEPVAGGQTTAKMKSSGEGA